MNMTLKRIASLPESTFGVLLSDNIPFAVTVERAWLNNQKGISCIPDGLYVCKRVTSPKFGNTFEVTNVSNRSEILFHKGNISEDSHGCIIIGEFFGEINNKPAIISSAMGFSDFLHKAQGLNEFSITITTC